MVDLASVQGIVFYVMSRLAINKKVHCFDRGSRGITDTHHVVEILIPIHVELPIFTFRSRLYAFDAVERERTYLAGTFFLAAHDKPPVVVLFQKLWMEGQGLGLLAKIMVSDFQDRVVLDGIEKWRQKLDSFQKLIVLKAETRLCFGLYRV